MTTITEEIVRASYIDGLRALADVLEDHPEVPLPYHGHGCEISINFLSGPDPRERLAAAARAFPCDWRKDAWEAPDGGAAYFDLLGKLHGLRLKLAAYREAVCTRVVTGTEDREVEEVVTPAVTRTVTKPVEVVQWVCAPVLAPAKDEGTEAA